MKDFNVKPIIVYGEHALSRLDEYHYKKACIVTDLQMKKLGLLDLLTDQLDKQGIIYEIFDEVVPDTTSTVVERGLLHIIHSKPDVVFALGGGSSIDTAKAVIYYFHQLKETFLTADMVIKPDLVAIPTTAGTGSEVTEYAVVTNVDTGLKIPITSKLMLPDLAILDPIFTKSAPDFITAETGIDTLTHAIEAYVSKESSEFSDSYALQSIKLIFEHLIPSYQDGSNLMRREKLLIASCMAGIAFNNSTLGINHSIAHALGGKFNISHGKSNGILLPYVMEYNAKDLKTQKKYADISRHLGFTFEDNHLGAMALIESVIMLKKALNIPKNLLDLGISHNQFVEQLDSMTSSAMADICTSGNPVMPTERDLRGIMLKLI